MAGKSLSELIAQKLISELDKSVGKLFRSKKEESRDESISEALNIIQKVTGGKKEGSSTLSEAIASKALGKKIPKQVPSEKTSSVDKKKYVSLKKSSLYTKYTSSSSKEIKSEDTLADALTRLYALIKKNSEKETLREETELDFKKVIEKEEEDKHKELIRAFLSKPKREGRPGGKPPTEAKGEKGKPGAKPTTKPTTRPTVTKASSARPSAKPSAGRPSGPSGGASGPSGGVSTATKVVTGAAAVALAGGAADVIASEEGLPKKGKAYYDPPGQKNLVSVGYGHQIKPEEYQQGFIQAGNDRIPLQGDKGVDTVLTPDQAKALLSADLPKYVKAAQVPLGESWNKLTDNQKSALTSYAYNTGSTKSLVKVGLKDAIDSGNIQQAANIIKEKGVKTSGGQINATLVTRRAKEADLFLSDAKATPSSTTESVPTQASKGDTLLSASTTNKDLKADQSTGGQSVVMVNNNNTTIARGTKKQPQVVPMQSDKAPILEAQYG